MTENKEYWENCEDFFHAITGYEEMYRYNEFNKDPDAFIVATNREPLGYKKSFKGSTDKYPVYDVWFFYKRKPKKRNFDSPTTPDDLDKELEKDKQTEFKLVM